MQTHRLGDTQLLLGNSDQQVGADGNPDLCLHCIGRVAVEGFDLQMLLHPLEKQFDLPALPIDLGDGGCWQNEVVGEEDKTFASTQIDEGDSAQSFGIGVGGLYARQPDQLIAAYSRLLVGGAVGLHPSVKQVLFGSDHEEGGNLVDSVESFEVVVGAIHGEDGAGLQRDPVQRYDIVDFGGCQGHKTGDGTAQIEQSVRLDRRLCFAKMSPRKDRQAKIDGGGVESKNGLIQFQHEGIVPVEAPGTLDQMHAEILIDQEAPFAVGIGQCRTRDFASKSYPVELVSMRMQTGRDVPQAISACELSKGHSEVLIPAGEVAYPTVPLISIDAFVEFVTGDNLKQLSEDGLLGHSVPRHVKAAGNCTPKP